MERYVRQQFECGRFGTAWSEGADSFRGGNCNRRKKEENNSQKRRFCLGQETHCFSYAFLCGNEFFVLV